MPKNKKVSLGFRTNNDQEETVDENWDIYPTHVIIPDNFWTISTTADED